jgi:hypothetical protein
MADDQTPDNELETLRAAIAQRDEQIAQANGRLKGMEETLGALRQPAPNQPPALPPGKRYAIPPQLRQQIAGLGLSETEIEKNGDIIVPFIQAYLGQAAGEVLTIIRQQADDIAQLTMLRDIEKFPHAETLFNDITKVRQAEMQQGRYVPVDVAYRIAVANNYERIAGEGSGTAAGAPGGQFGGTPPASPARAAPPTPVATRSRDLSAASALRGVRAPVTEPTREPRSGDDLLSMTREERKNFFAQNAETPIR